MLRTCATCGQPMTSTAAFCGNCGQPAWRACPHCGGPTAEGARFCGTCGADVVDLAGVPRVATPPQPTPVSPPAPVSPAPAPQVQQPVRYVAAAPAPGARGPRRPIPPVALALAAVVVLVAGALSTGIVKLPGTGTAPSGPVQSPPPIDNVATRAQGTLTLGDASAVETIDLAASGASPTISAPGQPWDGLKIDVPAGAWTGSTLSVTAQPITGSTFGKLVTPISPLYTISGAKGMAPAPVTLKVPATVPANSFAMGFFYDASGGLEGMPLLAEDGTSVTIASEHFSSFFLSLVDRALLPETIDSKFRPGKDDWQFGNDGSYITPGGECAGQTLTEAWYYIERRLKAGTPPLYGLYDNNGATEKTPDLWQDDSNGYRLASVAQSQYAANGNAVNKFFSSWRGLGFDTLQYDAFRYAIAVTGEPQLVSISDAQDKNLHMILAYRVDPSGIFVADPDNHGAEGLIPFDPASGKFGSYFSASVTYVNFVYKAKTAMVDWSALAADWAAFDAGTIGAGVFPAYDLEALAGQDAQGNDIWVPLTDGYQTAEKQLTIWISDPSNAANVQMTVYRGTSSTPDVPAFQQVKIDLSDGENPLGIYEQGMKLGSDWQYVNFVRLTVVRGPAESPSAAPSATSSPTPEAATPEPATAAPAGSWVLDGPQTLGEGDVVTGFNGCLRDVRKVGEGSFTEHLMQNPDNPCPTDSEMTVTGTWSPATMPANLQPRQRVPVTLAVTVSQHGWTNGAQASASVQAGTGTGYPLDKLVSLWANAPGNPSGPVTQSGTADIVVPDGSSGAVFRIIVVFSPGSSGESGREWWYHWQP